MTPTDIATEIYTEIDSTIVSQSSIEYWIRVNVGKLNSVIFSDFSVPATSSTDFLDEETGETMDVDQKNIYKNLYYLRYYQRLIDLYTGAAGVQTILELDSDGGKVKMIDKNSLSKTYLTLRKDLVEESNQQIHSYLKKRMVATQVSGDDTIAASGATEENSRE